MMRMAITRRLALPLGASARTVATTSKDTKDTILAVELLWHKDEDARFAAPLKNGKWVLNKDEDLYGEPYIVSQKPADYTLRALCTQEAYYREFYQWYSPCTISYEVPVYYIDMAKSITDLATAFRETASEIEVWEAKGYKLMPVDHEHIEECRVDDETCTNRIVRLTLEPDLQLVECHAGDPLLSDNVYPA